MNKVADFEYKLYFYVLEYGPCPPRELEILFARYGFDREARIACQHLLDDGKLKLDDRLKLVADKDYARVVELVDTQD